MSNIYAAFNGDDIGEQIGNHIANDDHESLARVSDGIKSAHDMIERWVESKGGKVVVSSGDEAIVTIPKQALAELKSIQQKYSQLANATVTVGVGGTMSEASKALIFGKMNDKNQIVHYDPSIDSQIAGDEDEEDLPNSESIEEDGFNDQQQEEGLPDDPEASSIDDGNGDEDNNESEFESEDEVAEDQIENEMESGDEITGDDYQDYEEGEEPSEENTAEMPLDEAIDEHEGLVDTLRSPSHEDDLEEADEQEEELEDYKEQAEGDELEDEDEFSNDEEELDPSQPEHEQDMSDEENFAHDAEENQDDEEDSDNIEADEEENTFGGNTEPEDDDFEEDAMEDAAAQDIDDEEDGVLAQDMDNDGDVDDQDVEMEDEAIQDLSNEDVASQNESELPPEDMEQNPEGDDQSVMTDMLHANIGDEESEDSDDEVKQDVIESLMSFKQNKQHLEELKQTNPEMYQANIMMLRAMIQMAKKLKMNPDAGMEDSDNVQAANEQFPQAEDGMEEDSQESLPNPQSMGKSEDLKKNIKGVHPSEKGIKGKFGISPAGSQLRSGDVKGAKESHKKVLVQQLSNAPAKLPKSERDNVSSLKPHHEYKKDKGMRDHLNDAKYFANKKNVKQAKQSLNWAKEAKKQYQSENPKKDNDATKTFINKSNKESKGVHKPYMSQGESMAGELAREGKNKPKTANKEVSRKMHSQKLSELKNIKPNLPKSESDSVSSFKQGDRVSHNVHGAGTVAGSHGQGIHSVNFDSVSDRNVKPTKVHEKNFQQKQRPVQKSEKPKVEQMNLDLKKQGKKPVKKQ